MSRPVTAASQRRPARQAPAAKAEVPAGRPPEAPRAPGSGGTASGSAPREGGPRGLSGNPGVDSGRCPRGRTGSAVPRGGVTVSPPDAPRGNLSCSRAPGWRREATPPVRATRPQRPGPGLGRGRGAADGPGSRSQPPAPSAPLARGPGSCPHLLPLLAPALGAGGRRGERKGREGGSRRGTGLRKGREGTRPGTGDRRELRPGPALSPPARAGQSQGPRRPGLFPPCDPSPPARPARPLPPPADRRRSCLPRRPHGPTLLTPRPCSRGPCGCCGTRAPPGEWC